MALQRGSTVQYKGKPHMYLAESKYIKGKHLIARQDKKNVVLTAVKTNDFVAIADVPFNFGLTPEQESKLAKF